MFGATNIVKNNGKENFVYRCYGIPFDGAGEQRFSDESARNTRFFNFDNSSSFYTDNQKNDFLILH